MNEPTPPTRPEPSTGQQPAPEHSAQGSSPPRGAALLRAVEVMDALRAPTGDAWTHQQSHSSLARYLLEETHEVLEVIEDPAAHGPRALPDELGDLLFQILFHARLGQEQEPAWDVDDVARAFIAKMERRNPHVFGPEREQALADPEDVEQIIAQWHAVKAAERARSDAGSVVDAGAGGGEGSGRTWFESIPARLPALQTAAKAVHRARSDGRLEELLAAADTAAGISADTPAGDAAVGDGDAASWGGDLARELLTLVVAAEARDVDPESALRALLARTERSLADGN